MKNYINGTLSCFCGDQYKKWGFIAASNLYGEDGMEQLSQSAIDEINKIKDENDIFVDQN